MQEKGANQEEIIEDTSLRCSILLLSSKRKSSHNDIFRKRESYADSSMNSKCLASQHEALLFLLSTPSGAIMQSTSIVTSFSLSPSLVPLFMHIFSVWNEDQGGVKRHVSNKEKRHGKCKVHAL